jgi:hypothetical protein
MAKEHNAGSFWPIVMMAVGIILIVGAGIWYLNPFGSKTENQLATPFVEDTYPEIPRVSLADAKAAFDMGSAVFVDVRDSGSYAQSHVKGAISIPLAELPDRLNELNPSDWIITYCT